VALRQIQLVTSADRAGDALGIIENLGITSAWSGAIGHDLALTTLVLDAHAVESVSDALHDALAHDPGYRLVLIPVEATDPKIESKEAAPEDEAPAWRPRIGRISRDELEEDIRGAGRADALFVAMTALATLVACVGLVKGSPTIVIGAMVIAPLLGPNTALALGTTLGDLSLTRAAVRANLIGLGVSVLVALAFGLATDPSVSMPEIGSRTRAGMGDIVLALASGAAGALAFSAGIPAALVGVMVAVALLPPAATGAMLASTGDWRGALGAATLASINVVCINLSATLVLRFQGVAPKAWWDRGTAKRATRRAIAMGTAALVLLVTLIALAPDPITSA